MINNTKEKDSLGPSASRATQRLTLALLFGAALFNYADRYMLAILIPDIRAELELSDTEIGFLSGLAFTLFYATMGIPIARLADAYSRRTIISIAMAIWSAMTAICGLAQTFTQLLVARVLVGVGEAGCTPPAHSIIADTFPLNVRAKALATYALGSPAGLLLGFLIGGWLTSTYGWRVALLVFGIPGLLYAAVIFYTLREPQRGKSDGITIDSYRPTFREVVATLIRRPSFIHCVLGISIHGIVYLGVVNWLPSFFVRSHGMGIAEVGVWLAFSLGLSQLAGIYIGGVIGDRYGGSDPRWYMWISGYAILAGAPFFTLVFLWPTPYMAFAAVAIPFFLGVMQAGPSYTVIQTVAGPRMRATAAAINIFIINLIGGGLGPQIIGSLSDYLAPEFGDDGLKYALLVVSIVFSAWAWGHFMLAARSVRADIEAAPT
ncbi:MAG: spinster family MFS transporter [Rhodospirillaceae bacterium]